MYNHASSICRQVCKLLYAYSHLEFIKKDHVVKATVKSIKPKLLATVRKESSILMKMIVREPSLSIS